MAETNGNGQSQAVEIDVTNELAFKAGVVKYLQLITDNTKDIPSLKKKVDKHEQIVQAGKWLSVPLFALGQATFKSLLAKLGW